MSRVLGAIVATAMVFMLVIFMLIVAPVFGALDTALYEGGPDVDSPITDQKGTIDTIVLRVVPMLLGLAALIYGFAKMAGRQARRGRI